MIGSRLRTKPIRLEGERSSALDLARGRLVLISFFFVAVLSVFAIRAFDLAIIQATPIGEHALHSVHQLSPKPHHLAGGDVLERSGESLAQSLAYRRAEIHDRNGELLAVTLKTASLYADTHLIAEPEETARQLVGIFESLQFGHVLQKLQVSMSS